MFQNQICLNLNHHLTLTKSQIFQMLLCKLFTWYELFRVIVNNVFIQLFKGFFIFK